MRRANSSRHAGIQRASAATLVRGSSGRTAVGTADAGGMIAVVAIVADAGDSIAEEAETAPDIIITVTGLIAGTIMGGTRRSGVRN